ncbi:MAG: hypothetical protein HQL69_06895 [Magnetococcales bacterium]|nr:hypothetical protein [Magnetococcales bacterium]
MDRSMDIHLPDALVKKLDGVPDKQSYIIASVEERLNREVEYEAWAVQEIEDSIEEAKEGKWVSHDEMKEYFRKIGVNVKD